MKKLLLLVGLISIASDAGTTSVASAAERMWRIRIDNRADPNALAAWASVDDIIVRACRNQLLLPCGFEAVIEGPTGINGAFDIWVPESKVPYASLGEIKVISTGNDLFVVDELRVFDTNGVQRLWWGLDDDQGYCVSQQASDQSNAACRDLGGQPICWFNFSKTTFFASGHCP